MILHVNGAAWPWYSMHARCVGSIATPVTAALITSRLIRFYYYIFIFGGSHDSGCAAVRMKRIIFNANYSIQLYTYIFLPPSKCRVLGVQFNIL